MSRARVCPDPIPRAIEPSALQCELTADGRSRYGQPDPTYLNHAGDGTAEGPSSSLFSHLRSDDAPLRATFPAFLRPRAREPHVKKLRRISRMFMNGIGTATPTARYTKADCWEAFQCSEWFARLDERAHAVTKTVLQRDNGIEARRLALSSLAEVFEIDPDTLRARGLGLADGVSEGAFWAGTVSQSSDGTM